MKHLLFQFLAERNIQPTGFSRDELYAIGIRNVYNNIEFYFDKKYTCESVIKELFIRGIKDHIEKNGKSV